MSIEEFLITTISPTAHNDYGVFTKATDIDIVKAKNKQLILRCAFDGEGYMFGQSWWRGTSGGGSPVSSIYSTSYTDKHDGLIKHLTYLLGLVSFNPFAKEITEEINKLKCKQMTIFDVL